MYCHATPARVSAAPFLCRQQPVEDDVVSERVARNQSRFREANDGIDVQARALDVDGRLPFICECHDGSCTTIARLTREEYGQVRSRGEWFLVAPGHEVTVVDGHDVARVVERADGFSLMEKIGRAGEVARQLDPRTEA